MELVQNYLTKNPCYSNGRKRTANKLMLHSVGCPQPKASAFLNSWNSSSHGVCVHAFIDGNDGKVYQALPWDARAAHCGSGSNGSGNNTHIGVEMCEPACIKYTGGSTFTCSNLAEAKACVERTYKSAVELFAMLCKKYGLDPLTPGNIVSHKEGHSRGIASNHGDPEHLWSQLGTGYTMDKFRSDVKNCMNGSAISSAIQAGSSAGQNVTQAPQQTNTSYPAVPFTVDVKINDLTIRKSPSMGDNKTGKYTGKGAFTIVEVSGSWGKLKSGAGWIYLANSSYLTIGSTVQSAQPSAPSQTGHKYSVGQHLNYGTSYKDPNSPIGIQYANGGSGHGVIQSIVNGQAKYKMSSGVYCNDGDISGVYTQLAPAPVPQVSRKESFIRDLQSVIGAKVDGKAGPETLSKTPTISKSKNNRHPAVRVVQSYFNDTGYNCGAIDGIAGGKFDSSAKSYQRDHGCVADGELTSGKNTWKSLLGLR